MKNVRLTFSLMCLLIVASCSNGPAPFSDTIGRMAANGQLGAMKPQDYFDSKIQIDLAEAASKGDTNRMQSLIDHGADVNCLGRDYMRPLFWALAKNKLSSFNFLLERGANPNITNADYCIVGLTTCLWNPKYLESLLQHGADPNAIAGMNATTAVAPIYIATLWNSVTNVSLLLRYGADVNLKLSNGTTPLHMAIYGNSYEIALFLYHRGADPKIKDNDGVSSVDTMKRFRNNGYSTHADKRAYHQLAEEFRKAGLMDSK